MKKLISLLLSAMMLVCTAVSLVACGGDDGNITVLDVTVQSGGLGQKWMRESADRFIAAIGDKSYAEGKNGVKINIVSTYNPENTIDSDGYSIMQVSAEGVHSTAITSK